MVPGILAVSSEEMRHALAAMHPAPPLAPPSPFATPLIRRSRRCALLSTRASARDKRMSLARTVAPAAPAACATGGARSFTLSPRHSAPGSPNTCALLCRRLSVIVMRLTRVDLRSEQDCARFPHRGAEDRQEGPQGPGQVEYPPLLLRGHSRGRGGAISLEATCVCTDCQKATFECVVHGALRSVTL